MKKLLAFIGAAAFVVAIVLVVAKPVTANAQPGATLAGLCQQLGYPERDCVSRLATLGPAIICGGVDVHGVDRWVTLGYKSKGECVSDVQQYVRDAARNQAP